MSEAYCKTKQRAKKETIEWLHALATRNECNYALTINPNDENLSLEIIKERMKKLDKRILSTCYKNRSKRMEFFFIATFEHSYVDSYHVHLVLRIPDGTDIAFKSHIKDAIKGLFPKASCDLKAIFDLYEWVSYITKQQWHDNLNNNYCFSKTGGVPSKWVR
ncbi:hypothetical protein [Wohlfahrtiimonas populi]|uniref:hypothetical protein n=1 Tax=Wohlfahrtiimonas populi TaxID=1940240 RepID=UPI00098D41A3|nr:hypothetical protein [Wohlfahrtiimonas populi]